MDINYIYNNAININNNEFMKTIKQHLEQVVDDPQRFSELSRILKRGTITLEQWRMTAKFMENKIEYAGLGMINISDEGEFIYKDFKSKDLDEVEDKLWKDIAEKLWQ